MKIEKWSVDKLKPYDKNSKKHDKEQVKKIAKSISTFGWDQPIVVDKEGVIIKGHGRRLAAIELGLKEVPVLVRDDLSEEEVRAARLADNRVAISGIDSELFRAEIADLDFDLTGIFDAKEIEFTMEDLGEVDPGSFIDNLDDHKTSSADINLKRELGKEEVKLSDVWGFTKILRSEEKTAASFLAILEAKTGLYGSDALVKYMEDFVKEA